MARILFQSPVFAAIAANKSSPDAKRFDVFFLQKTTRHTNLLRGRQTGNSDCAASASLPATVYPPSHAVCVRAYPFHSRGQTQARITNRLRWLLAQNSKSSTAVGSGACLLHWRRLLCITAVLCSSLYRCCCCCCCWLTHSRSHALYHARISSSIARAITGD